jgi:2-haloacid dehalogenase
MVHQEGKQVVFDLGGVLIDWNPTYLYKRIFRTREAMDYFLKNVCTFEWNEAQDGGRPISEATRVLIQNFPEYALEINSFYDYWPVMLGGPIPGTVELLEKIRTDQKHSLYALTNWSAETFPVALERFEFLGWFEGILVSGEENLKKPDVAFYKRLEEKYTLIPSKIVFIDDNLRNIAAAKQLGWDVIHFQDPEILKVELLNRSLL